MDSRWKLARPARSTPLSLARPALAVALLCLFLPLTLRARDDISKLEAQYQSETDPVSKAKVLAKIGPLEIKQMRADMKSGSSGDALAGVQHYRDQVRETVAALNAAGLNAERHPSGFKELQISLREFLRRFDDFIADAPISEQEALQTVRSDLALSQNSLMNALFPPDAEGGRKKRKSS